MSGGSPVRPGLPLCAVPTGPPSFFSSLVVQGEGVVTLMKMKTKTNIETWKYTMWYLGPRTPPMLKEKQRLLKIEICCCVTLSFLIKAASRRKPASKS